MRSSGAVAFALILTVVTTVARAQPSEAPPSVEQAVQRAYMLYCLPLVGKEANNSNEVARWLKYEPTALPNFGALRVRSAPAWLVPSLAGRVVVTRGAVDERMPLSCEIIVSGAQGEALRKKTSEMVACDKCPFVRNAEASREQNGIRMDKYDWRMPEKKALMSVIAYTFPKTASGVDYLLHVHMVR